jgi:ParB family chromosome partitioning protein
MDVDESEVAEIALIENMQRKDLTPWEEADGLRALCERFGYTHEEVAKKVGKSRSTVTEALSIAAIPEEIREICRDSEINSKSLLLQIVRQPDDESMRAMAQQIGVEGLTRDGARKARKAYIDPTGASEPYVYRFEAPGREFKVEVKFKKANISPEELFEALNAAAQNIDDAM